METWTQALTRLKGAGYGERIARCYREASLKVAEEIGPQGAIDLANTLSFMTIKTGSNTSETFLKATCLVATRCADAQGFAKWLTLMADCARSAPRAIPAVLDRMEMLAGRLDVDALDAWIRSGLRSAEADPVRQLAYFRLQTPESVRALAQEAGDGSYDTFEREMRAFLIGLYGLDLQIREFLPANVQPADQRATFADGAIAVPVSFPGYKEDELRMLYRASLAHIGAHFAYTKVRFQKGGLRPAQIATASLVEDARVEHLAMRDMPGLRRLWAPFHAATPSPLITAPNLLECLARALFDPDFVPVHGWIRKGREMFFSARDQWDDPSLSRHIGNLLGNDLGQMRVQLNAKGYVVKPVYRDDNTGLWDFGDRPERAGEQDLELQIDSARLRPPDEQHVSPAQSKAKAATENVERVRAVSAEDTAGRVVGRYPEFDGRLNTERSDWTTIRHYPAKAGDPGRYDALLEARQPLIDRLTTLLSGAELGEARKARRQLNGEALDLEAAVDALIEHHSGKPPDPRVFERRIARPRNLAVSILLDTSQSTADPVGNTGKSVLELAVEASIVLAVALKSSRDAVAIDTFCSAGRQDVRFTPILSFQDPLTAETGALLTGLSAGYSTRLGAALRHAGSALAAVAAHRRLILLLSDGEPSDIDCADPNYLFLDTKHAIRSLSQSAIDVFCVGLGEGPTEKQAALFGRSRFAQVGNLQLLPEKLAALYVSLSR
ncbi:MAG: VWA domain-containing protein [Roseibium sp.]|uniref:nitric oxide reductase activation protein NorD n=1 Tax=Roseibium sp. TaxID=1936156 RepID=UPI003D9C29E2